ncbi:MAG: ABC transporter ATP-binding protein [Acidimicrobiales bacterium]
MTTAAPAEEAGRDEHQVGTDRLASAAVDRSIPEPAPPEVGGWIRRLWPFLMAHRRNVVIAFGMAVLGQVVSAFTPVLSRAVVDDGIVAQTRPVWPFLVALVAAGAFSFGAAYVRRWVGGRVSLDVQYDLRVAIFERLQRLDFGTQDALQTGQLVSRSSSDLGLIQGLLAFLPIIVGNLVMLVVSLFVMLWLSPPLTLVMLAAIPLLLVVSLRMRNAVFPATWDAQQRAGEVAGVVDEAVTGVRVVKGFGQEDRELEHLATTARGLYSSRSRLVRLQARYGPALQAIPAYGQVAVLALGGWLAFEGHITLGTFLAFSTYLVQLVAPVRMLAGLFAVGQQARAGAERILDVLDANAEVTDAPDAVDLPVIAGEVVFDDVRFGYTRSTPVLDGFSLRVEPGEVVALVGSSGSGKSTVTALLPRFYDVADGRVSVDGHDVRDVTLSSLRRQVGVVFEDAFLFSDSVRANIAYGDPDADDEAVVAAARAAGAHEFVTALPDGYATLVGERGLTLSGGQRQRIALARAILTDPRILVLDDATSAVDAATEEAIHATLRTLMDGRTTLIIAHRRSTLRLAQRIVVLDRGRVVDQGTHDELLARNERYRALLQGPEAGDDLAPGSLDLSFDAGGVTEAPSATEPTADQPDADERTADGTTAAAWPAVDSDAPVASAAVAGPARLGPGGGGGGGGGAAMGMSLAATPDLLERLDRLPPADDDPHVDVTEMAAEPTGRFRILAFVRPWRRWLTIGLALVALDSALSLLGPLLVRRALDSGVDAGDLRVVWGSSLLFALVVSLDWLVSWGSTWITGRTAERALFGLRVKIFAHLGRQSLDYYDRELDGRIMTRMTTDVEALSQLIQTGLVTAVVAGVTCLGVLVFLVVLSPPLAAAASVVLPPLALATWWYRRRSSETYGRARDAIADVNANLQENLSGVRVAQAYVREGRNVGRFRDVNQQYLRHRLRAQRLISLYFPFVLFLADLAAVAVLGAGAMLVPDGVVTAGVVVAFLLYLDMFFSPIQQLSQVLDTWQQAGASVTKIEELLDTPSRTPEAAEPIDPGTVAGAVHLRSVRFRYPDTVGDPALDGIDLEVPSGQTVALVGETGAGKSTLVKLVARFYDPDDGAVLVDGIDLRDIDLGTYRRQLGIVPQEAFLFTGTVRDNIAYGRPDASDAEVEAAARAVGAHDFIAALPLGYREPVSERGRSLSAGQRQLLALARARCVDPAVLLLDEATSQLDLASEARVQRAMQAASTGRTTILVAHRLPTAARADRIVVVDGGRIVQDGTHDDLLQADGPYRRLWAAFAASDEPAAVA